MMELTQEMTAIIEAVKNTKDNLLINALAGTGKTSTLVEVTKAIPEGTSILSLAFNKVIAKEMKKRMPDYVTCSTLNALGHRAWRDKIDFPLNINYSKFYDIFTMRTLHMEKDEKTFYWDMFKTFQDVFNLAKAFGYVPPKYNGKKYEAILNKEEFYNSLDYELDTEQEEFIDTLLVVSIKQAFEGSIDFNDQLYMPTMFYSLFPEYDVVLVDEAQDLSLINIRMIDKIVRKKRVIVAGDAYQAIYAFRGADENSIANLAKHFNLVPYSLTTTWRCSKEVVKFARFRAKELKAAPTAREGEVNMLGAWDKDDLQAGDAIICRNNAPLYAMAIRLLKQGVSVSLGKDGLQSSIMSILKEVRKKVADKKSEKQFIEALAIECEVMKTKVREHAHKAIDEKFEIIYVCQAEAKTIDETLIYFESLCSVEGSIKLMTGHKAKGLEWNRVFFLNEELLGKGVQEKNLRYVMVTRAKDVLNFVNSGLFMMDRPTVYAQ